MHHPFAQLNLRRNPFGNPSPQDWSTLAVVDDGPLLAFLNQPGRRAVQLMGHCGRGKSTHMRVLHNHFPDAPLLYFGPEEPHPRIPRKAPVVFLDETQRIAWWRREIIWRRHQRLVIGTHQDHERELRRAGVEVMAVTIEGLTPTHLRRILERRIDWATRAKNGPKLLITDALLRGLIDKYGDDLRAMIRLLYAMVQQMTTPGVIPWPPDATIREVEPSKHLADGGVRHVITRATNPLDKTSHLS